MNGRKQNDIQSPVQSSNQRTAILMIQVMNHRSVKSVTHLTGNDSHLTSKNMAHCAMLNRLEPCSTDRNREPDTDLEHVITFEVSMFSMAFTNYIAHTKSPLIASHNITYSLFHCQTESYLQHVNCGKEHECVKRNRPHSTTIKMVFK